MKNDTFLASQSPTKFPTIKRNTSHFFHLSKGEGNKSVYYAEKFYIVSGIVILVHYLPTNMKT